MSLFSRGLIASFGITLLSIAVFGAEVFKPGPASSYPTHQTNDKVTIAAIAYDTAELAHTAFGKLDPNQHGVLPVLVVIQNDTGQVLKMDHIEVKYSRDDGSQVESTPAKDLPYLAGAQRPTMVESPSPIPRLRKKKNPLSAWELDGRAFAAKMVLMNEAANGFFYFQTRRHSGDRLYLTGITEAKTGKEIFYFEIPLDVAGK